MFKRSAVGTALMAVLMESEAGAPAAGGGAAEAKDAAAKAKAAQAAAADKAAKVKAAEQAKKDAAKARAEAEEAAAEAERAAQAAAAAEADLAGLVVITSPKAFGIHHEGKVVSIPAGISNQKREIAEHPYAKAHKVKILGLPIAEDPKAKK